MAFEVIVCGSLHLDIVVRAPNLPRIDETAIGRHWQQICGGKDGTKPFKQLKSARRLQ